MSMKYFIGDQEILAESEALELGLDLWLSPGEESDEEQAARVDAGRDILAEDPELFDYTVRVIVDGLERHTAATTPPAKVLPFRPRHRALKQGAA